MVDTKITRTSSMYVVRTVRVFAARSRDCLKLWAVLTVDLSTHDPLFLVFTPILIRLGGGVAAAHIG